MDVNYMDDGYGSKLVKCIWGNGNKIMKNKDKIVIEMKESGKKL